MRKFAIPLLCAVLAIVFLYFRTIGSIEEFGELAPEPSTEAGPGTETELEQATPAAASGSERTPVPLPAFERTRNEPEATSSAGMIRGLVLDPHRQPVRAHVRYAWNDRGRLHLVNARSSKEGHFVLELPRADMTGDLLVSVDEHAWSPTALTGVTPGANDLVLTLGVPAFFEVEFRDREGITLPNPKATFFWELAGDRVQDYPGPRRKQDGRWAVSPVPFWISAQPPGTRSAWHGPFDPRDVGPRLILEVERLPVVRGRVVHGGAGVEGALVELEPLSDGSSEARGVSFSPRGPSARTDSDGRFQISAASAGRQGPVAFHRPYGSGRASAVELDGEHGLDGIEIELDSAPGALLATVILPQGRSPRDVWLKVSGGSGYRTAKSDGTFSLPHLEPGICRVSVTDGDEGHGEDRWVNMTHGPGPPDWLAQEFTFEAEVLAGETRAIELDLTRQPDCRLQGAVSIGTPFLGVPALGGYGPETQSPRLILDRGDPWEPDAAVPLDHEGRFLLGVTTPGSRRLFLELGFPELDLHWEIIDEVELQIGTREWNLATAPGSLRLLPPDLQRPIWSGPVLDWHGPSTSLVRVKYPLVEEADGSVFYHHVPAGTVTFSLERSGTKREYSCEIRAGETTELRLAE
ncbi:MAG: hypothetical protein ABL998_09045 [Planctomycetota bacterium]